eukprot:TRINITY_DN15130_c0_g1_i1.p1 TRINITY_DN15130_c0_g1~~TRINITY_DN15130_c0_g1_i1.p1  ORF type:complete len:625 (-),score=174.08 TRINITY_DN15130_c0_g1_i1:26-1900(-)
MEFGSEYILNAADEEENLEGEKIVYSDCEVDDDEAIKTTTKIKKADTNVVSVDFNRLEEKGTLMTGDPVNCVTCGAFLTAISQIIEENSKQIWNCEFCSTPNEVSLSPEEIPKEMTLDYVIENPSESVCQTTGSSIIVFCIDISGSMCVTQETTTQGLKGKRKEALQSFQQFNDDHSDQYLPGEKRNVNYVSRLQCAQAAVSSQLETMTQNAVLVTFNNDVTIIGDGFQEPAIIAGDKLFDYEHIKTVGEAFPTGKSIQESRETLLEKLFNLEETGGTALGPALLASVSLATKFPGSQVIICTDGLANTGVGDLGGGDEPADEFYAKVTELAKSAGVVVNVLSIVGTECRIEKLGSVSDGTGGKVDMVDPLNLAQRFSSILSDKVLATNLTATLLVHKNLTITREPSSAEPAATQAAESNVLTKKVGTVTTTSEITFELSVKDNPSLGDSLPFQVQLRFCRPSDGSGGRLQYVRVLAQTKKVSTDRELVEKNANFAVLGTHFGQQTAQLALQGKYSEARTNAYAKKKLLKRAAKTEFETNYYSAWKSEISSADRVLSKQQKLEKQKGRNYSDDEEEDEMDTDDEDVKNEARKKKRAQVSRMRSTERDDATSNTLFRLKRYQQKK